MIISCIKCNKKFEVDANLIPDSGRILQCGSCSYKWHYTPFVKLKNEIKTDDVNKNIDYSEPTVFNDDENDLIEDTNKDDNKDTNNKKNQNKIKEVNKNIKQDKDSKINFLNLLLVGIITFIALIVIIDTFKTPVSNFIPDINMYLDSLYETLLDIYLFTINLLK
jgi:hypothetical protein